MSAVLESAASGLISIAIPKVGEHWPGQGGRFRGIARGENGQPDYLLIEHDEELPVGTWDKAVEAAKAVEADGHKDFSLPNRAEAALLYANAKDAHEPDWYWTSEQHASDPSFAWFTYFYYGGQDYYPKGNSTRARAVRRIPIQ